MGIKLTGPGTSLRALHIGLPREKGGKGQELLGFRPSLPDLSIRGFGCWRPPLTMDPAVQELNP